MNINWIQIITTVLMVVLGFLAQYFKTKTDLIAKAQDAINYAEKEYESATKAGGLKMEWAIGYLYSWIPAPVKVFFPEEFLRRLVQATFDRIAEYATMQLDKVVDSVIKED